MLRSEGCFRRWLFAVWEGRVCLDAGMGEEEGEIGEGRGRGDIFTFTDGIINRNISLMIPSAILLVKWINHCTEIPV